MKPINLKISLCLLLVLSHFPQAMLGFSTTGHFIIARIAEREIEQKEFYPQLLELLSILGGFTKETNHPFVESATWADEIKYLGWNAMNKWHYDNVYVNGSKIIPKSSYPSLGLYNDPTDIVFAINSAKTTLRNKRESLADDRLGKGIMIRMLIHLVGDIHQPLHACTLVNDQFIKGDVGGNKFVVDMPGARNLHSYWDKCLKKYSLLKSPLSELHFNKLETFVDKIMMDYPRSNREVEPRLSITSVRAWANESVKNCLKYVYNGISPGDAPSKEYIERGKTFIDQQLAVAGYRLADTLISLFSNLEVLSSHLKNKTSKIINTDPETASDVYIAGDQVTTDNGGKSNNLVLHGINAFVLLFSLFF